MIPAADTEHQISVGDFHRVNYSAQSFETVSTISACFGNGTLIDFVQAGQNNVVLTVRIRIDIVAVGVFAGVNLF
jgi:hypothetical protein